MCPPCVFSPPLLQNPGGGPVHMVYPERLISHLLFQRFSSLSINIAVNSQYKSVFLFAIPWDNLFLPHFSLYTYG